MTAKITPFISRLTAAVVIAALVAALIPQIAFAASVPTLTILEVKPGESVKVHGANFPKNVDFTFRMDEIGNLAIGGIVVGSLNSGSGSFDATFNIPASLKDKKNIAIRADGTGGWYSYNWFTNQTGSSTPAPTPAPGTKPYIEVIAVKANQSITVQAHRFPENQTFQIRVGSFKNFFKDYVVTGSINSGKGGSFQFNVDLPASVKNVSLVTIRLDSPQKQYAYNVFKNVDAGSVPVTSPTPAPVTGNCQIVSTLPGRALSKGEDFDAVWTVKNISNKDWLVSSVDYKYISGNAMHKYASLYDLPVTVKAGETIKITVDMLAAGQAGVYAVNWAIVQGNTTLCTLPLTLTVR